MVSTPESVQESAKDYFERWTKPSELAEEFYQHAMRMVELGLSFRKSGGEKGDRIIPSPGVVDFEIELEVEHEPRAKRVAFHNPSLQGKITHEISFSPPGGLYKDGIVDICDGSRAGFTTSYYDEKLHLVDAATFERILLFAGDGEVNSFFQDLIAAHNQR